MSVPAIMESHLGGEQVAAHVPIGGEDALFVTPSRTLIYRAEGLLSDESVEEYPHNANRIEVSEGRRKTKITLDYGLDGGREFTVASKYVDDALHPVLAGVLNAANITDPGETITQTYRFSELTLVITSDRVVKHVGETVWDEDFEEYHYDDVTGVEVEEGNVSSQIVLEVGARQQRIKAQNEVVREIQERLKRSLTEYHGVETYAEFEAAVKPDTDADDVEERASVEFDENLKPITTDGADDDQSTETNSETEFESADDSEDPLDAAAEDWSTADQPDTTFEESGFEAASSDIEENSSNGDIVELRRSVERQNELLETQQEMLEEILASLSRDR